MPRPLSNDLRERIIEAVEGGMSCNAAAEVYDVAISTVVKLVQRWKSTGSYEAKPMGGYRGHKLSDHKELVMKLVESQPDATLAELGEQLKANKIKTSRMGIFRFLKHLDLSYKKNRTRQRTRTA
jgi:transposase